MAKLLTILFSFISLFAAAQTQFSGRISDLPSPGGNLFIEFFEEKGWKILSKGQTDINGDFNIPLIFPHSGVYRLRHTSSKDWTAVFLVSEKMLTEKTITIQESVLNGIDAPVKSLHDFENELFTEVAILLDSLRHTYDSSDPLKREYLQLEHNIYAKLSSIALKNPNAWVSQHIIKGLVHPESEEWKKSNPDINAIIAFNKKHLWDNVPMDDMKQLYSPSFARNAMLYYQYFANDSVPDLYIDNVLKRSFDNEEMNSFLFKFILDLLLDYKNEPGVDYLLTWYAPDCSDNETIGAGVKNLILALENCKPGNHIPELNLPNNKGERISLTETAKKNNITILMFWRTNCTHCKEFEPELEEIYKKYKAMGVEVYAIGSDKDEADWKAREAESPMPWTSVFLAYDSRKDFNKTFPVPSTPTLIAVDNNGVILRRLIMRSKLESILDEMLLEIKK
ncbi:MAG: TlpA disulfide reductase family protein [Flavobacteriales bacterium]